MILMSRPTRSKFIPQGELLSNLLTNRKLMLLLQSHFTCVLTFVSRVHIQGNHTVVPDIQDVLALEMIIDLFIQKTDIVIKCFYKHALYDQWPLTFLYGSLWVKIQKFCFFCHLQFPWHYNFFILCTPLGCHLAHLVPTVGLIPMRFSGLQMCIGYYEAL